MISLSGFFFRAAASVYHSGFGAGSCDFADLRSGGRFTADGSVRDRYTAVFAFIFL